MWTLSRRVVRCIRGALSPMYRRALPVFSASAVIEHIVVNLLARRRNLLAERPLFGPQPAIFA